MHAHSFTSTVSAKKNGMVSLAGKWIELQAIMLNKVSHRQILFCFLSCEDLKIKLECIYSSKVSNSKERG